MARKFLTPIDLSQQELRQAKLESLASPPASPVNGQVYYDSGLNASLTWNGTSWAAHDATKLVGVIPNTALATNPLDRQQHINQQAASTISDLATAVKAYHLSEFASPTTAVPFNGQKLTGLGAPSGSGDAATWDFVTASVQSAAAGIASKPPVRLVATANIPLNGLSAIDGIVPSAGDRVLAVGQTDPKQNGPYSAASGAWSRVSPTADAVDEIQTGSLWLATEGTAGAATQWRLSTTGSITVGTTPISIVQFGAASVYTASDGITLTGGAFSAKPKAGGNIVVDAAGISVDTSVVTRKFMADIGDGSATSFNIAHGLGTTDIVVQVRQTASPYAVVEVDIEVTSAAAARVAFSSAPAAGAYRAVVVG